MAYKIGMDCEKCGSCEPECENQAISEGEETYVIDPARCTECVGNFASPKCFDICPMAAPERDPAHQETKEQLLAKWRKLHPGKTPKTF
jgi:ferredoxin